MGAQVYDVRWICNDRRGPRGFATEKAAVCHMDERCIGTADYYLTCNEVRVGDGATVHTSCDMVPHTVVAVSSSGKTVSLREDRVLRARCTNGHKHICDCPLVALVEPQDDGELLQARAAKDGTWRILGSRYAVTFGRREYYRDPHI